MQACCWCSCHSPPALPALQEIVGCALPLDDVVGDGVYVPAELVGELVGHGVAGEAKTPADVPQEVAADAGHLGACSLRFSASRASLRRFIAPSMDRRSSGDRGLSALSQIGIFCMPACSPSSLQLP